MPIEGLKTHKPSGAIPYPCILLEGEEKAGKAMTLDSRLVTPTGWTAMGQIAVGDEVIGSDGRPTEVLAVHDRGERPVYRVTFSDGAAVEVCNEHLWAVQTSNDRHRRYANGPHVGQRRNLPWRVWDTDTLREKVLDGVVVHIPLAAPVQYAPGDTLPLDPYLLGLLLGDGGMSKPSWPTFTSGEEEMFDRLAALLPAGDTVRRSPDGRSVGIAGGQVTAALRGLGLMGTGSATKFVPDAYLVASVADRLALLQGLMDTDGGMERRRATLTTVSLALAAGARELVESLGGTAATSSKETSYVNAAGERITGKRAYRLAVRLPAGLCPFRLGRKVAAWTAARPTSATRPTRTVREVEFLDTEPVRCITVAAADHLYLTEHFVVTHNSWAIAEFTRSERTGTLYWIDLNEAAAEEYGAIPGADYEVVELEKGDYHELLRDIELIKGEARRAADAGEPPVVLGIDSGSAIWSGLKDWASDRARSSNKAKQILARDPNADIQITQNLWNDAGARWRKIQTHLVTFPGIVVVTARGKEVTEVIDGRPVEGSKVWAVECHKELPYAATVWVRMRRDFPPEVIGARSVHAGIKPGSDKSKRIDAPEADGRLLEWLVFDALKCDPAKAHVRDLTQFTGGGLTDDEQRDALAAQGNVGQGQTGQRPSPQTRRPTAAPTPAQAARRISQIRTLEEVETFETLLEQVGMAGVDAPDTEYTLGELLRGRREALTEAATRPATQDAAEVSAAALAAAWESAPQPAVAPAEPPHVKDPTPDAPEDCRLNAARRGVLSSLEQMGTTVEQINAHFGRKLETVATRKLTGYVREIIATRREA